MIYIGSGGRTHVPSNKPGSVLRGPGLSNSDSFVEDQTSMSEICVLVGTLKGAFVYFSDNERRDWRLCGPYLNSWEFSAMLGVSGRQKRIFAGTCHMAYGATLRISDDFGETWKQLETGPSYPTDSGLQLRRIWQIAPGAPSEPDTLYAGVDEAGLFVSRNFGETWSEVEGFNRHPDRERWSGTQGGLPLHTILVDPQNPKRLWVALSDGGVYRTGDAGETWKPCVRGLPGEENAPSGTMRGVHKIVLDPHNPNRLYLQHTQGVFESTNGGETWVPIHDGLPSLFGFPIAASSNGDLYIVPLDPQTRCFIEGRICVYRRKTGSGEWEPLQKGLPETPYFGGVLRDAFTVDEREPAGIAFGTTQGDVFHSSDGGATWAALPGHFSRITTVKTFFP
jgi:hypothetical protein